MMFMVLQLRYVEEFCPEVTFVHSSLLEQSFRAFDQSFQLSLIGGSWYLNLLSTHSYPLRMSNRLCWRDN